MDYVYKYLLYITQGLDVSKPENFFYGLYQVTIGPCFMDEEAVELKDDLYHMKNIKITILILLVIAIAIIALFIATKPTPEPTPGPVACTEEAKLCPDGSYVSRTGPQCQFSACPTNTVATTTPTSTATTPKTTSGLTGTVLLGPSCPVMRDPPDPQCADKPYKAALVVTTPDESRVITEFSSDTTGKFKVNVLPGEYLIRSAPTTNFYPRCSSNGNVIVKAGIFTDTSVSCDTGIR